MTQLNRNHARHLSNDARQRKGWRLLPLVAAFSVTTIATIANIEGAAAEPVERTYPPTTCAVSDHRALERQWSKDISGLRNFDLQGTLFIECPVLKDNIGAQLTRAFAWVKPNGGRSGIRCSLGSRRISGDQSSFFTTRITRRGSEPQQLVFKVENVIDQAFPPTGDVVRPSAYTIRCSLPRQSSGAAAFLGYHVEEDIGNR